ncbi:dolichyl-phosphate-mannose--protein mannosyltransferase [Anaeramoeba flamelloides]|uniref:Dolichyl-phosphate-mannose--protein mannosyltransferase n=1 Tax=Anaeramoeba flamelloides TaxID=1746091 RepID=A0AAV8A9D3_9EUKA|nr:dolichyl-phosphate-mannose--protein mannosyltransferase [Anaeramoeba flamelloides]
MSTAERKLNPETLTTRYQKLCQLASKNGFDLDQVNRAHNKFVVKRKLVHFLVFLLLFGISFSVHFWRLSEPNKVVFDEVHFGKFVSWYMTGEYFFDIHPPLAKLVQSSVAKMCNFKPDVNAFSHIGGAYPKDVNYMCLRVQSAFLSSLIGPTFYLLFVNFGLSLPIAIVSSFFFIFENSILIESRMLVTDGFLFFFISLTIIFNLKLSKCKPFTKGWLLWMTITAVSLSCSVSTKFTALGTYAAVGISQIVQLISHYKSNSYKKNYKNDLLRSELFLLFLDTLIRGIIFLGSTALIFLISFAFHFELLTYNGSGDAFMTKKFLTGLIPKDSNQIPNIQLNFFQRFWELLRTMHSSNMGLDATHHYSSKWYHWPLHIGTPVRFES